jgi:transcriptional regulator with XRE-family HTH domain
MAYGTHAKVRIDAARLRTVRIEQEFTQQSLAEQAGMPFTTVNRIESEVYRSVEITTKRALEAVLGVDLTPSRWIHGRRGRPATGWQIPDPDKTHVDTPPPGDGVLQ